VKQERVIEHVSERQQGISTEARGRGVVELTTREGVEPPRGHGDLNAIRALADETL
jgi:hypothetical protein